MFSSAAGHRHEVEENENKKRQNKSKSINFLIANWVRRSCRPFLIIPETRRDIDDDQWSKLSNDYLSISFGAADRMTVLNCLGQ